MNRLNRSAKSISQPCPQPLSSYSQQ